MVKAPVAKETEYFRIILGGQQYNINPKVGKLFQQKAGDKLQALEEAAGKLVAEGKTPERALADTLEAYRLV